MVPATIPSLAPHRYYNTRVELFTPCRLEPTFGVCTSDFRYLIYISRERLKFKCLLCEKVLKSAKLINHIKYFHNFSLRSLLDCFNSTAVKLDFNDSTLTLEQKVGSNLNKPNIPVVSRVAAGRAGRRLSL